MPRGVAGGRGTYPQVDPRAAGLMTRRVVVVAATSRIAEAYRTACRARAELVVARLGARWGAVSPAILERALGLGLEAVAIEAVLWLAPLVAPDAAEIAVRRRLGPGQPFVLVGGEGRPAGAVLHDPAAPAGLPLSVAGPLAALPAELRMALRGAGSLGDTLGVEVAAVGGFVRDLVRGRGDVGGRDLDLAVDGDGCSFARRLAREAGGQVEEHPLFLTATVLLPGPRRIDVVTARQERYAAPGALPVVAAAPLTADLLRRDFSVNALAVRLNRSCWGQLVDPAGGVVDLRRRRLRILHPLSFVEDPTRVFRAARFAVRLGARLDASTRRLLGAAVRLPVFRALSGDRLRAELAAMRAEPDPAAATIALGRAGGFRLIEPDYRFGRGPARRLADLQRETAALPLAAETREALQFLALVAHLPVARAESWATRLGIDAGRRRVLAAAPAVARDVVRRLDRTRDRGAAHRILRGVSELAGAWACVTAPPGRTRRAVALHLTCWRTLRMLVGGRDLIALGMAPGPSLGSVLEELRAAQVAGRIRSRAQALRWARARARAVRPHEPSATRPGRRGGRAWQPSTCS